MPTTQNLFFGEKIDQLFSWQKEFLAKVDDPAFVEKEKAIRRFVRDCQLLRRDMKKEEDPALCDSVDLDNRYHVLEATRRRLINEVPRKEASY